MSCDDGGSYTLPGDRPPETTAINRKPTHRTKPSPSPSAGPRFNWRSLVTAVPDLVIAGTFLLTWIEPFALGESAVEYAMLTMLLEFIIVHSSAFMGQAMVARGDPAKRALVIVGFGVLYTLFVGGFAIGFHTWWPLIAFWSLTFNRLLGVFVGDVVEGKEKMYIQAGWALSALYYIGGIFATIFIPLPRLGLPSAVVEKLDLPGSGLWVDEPQRVIAFGVLYFGLSGIGELLGWAKNESFLKGVPKN